MTPHCRRDRPALAAHRGSAAGTPLATRPRYRTTARRPARTARAPVDTASDAHARGPARSQTKQARTGHEARPRAGRSPSSPADRRRHRRLHSRLRLTGRCGLATVARACDIEHPAPVNRPTARHPDALNPRLRAFSCEWATGNAPKYRGALGLLHGRSRFRPNSSPRTAALAPCPRMSAPEHSRRSPQQVTCFGTSHRQAPVKESGSDGRDASSKLFSSHGYEVILGTAVERHSGRRASD